MELYKPPNPYLKSGKTLFLAGSIEMGSALLWQDEVVTYLKEIPVHVLNPRRDAWDSDWLQDIHNPIFSEQVTWELDGILLHADIVFFYFDPNTKSPITLLELGLCLSQGKKVIVCCPEGFWRKGNVDITCRRFDVPVYVDLSLALNELSLWLKN